MRGGVVIDNRGLGFRVIGFRVARLKPGYQNADESTSARMLTELAETGVDKHWKAYRRR